MNIVAVIISPLVDNRFDVERSCLGVHELVRHGGTRSSRRARTAGARIIKKQFY